jgi:hypothetical protein
MSFWAARVNQDTGYRTDQLTLRGIVMTNTLGTQSGINLVNRLTLIDRSIRANRLADITVNTFIGDLKRHEYHSVS